MIWQQFSPNPLSRNPVQRGVTILNDTKTFPPGDLRYCLVAIDTTQSPQADSKGCFRHFEAAVAEAKRLIPSHADYAMIYDSKRGYAVARVGERDEEE